MNQNDIFAIQDISNIIFSLCSISDKRAYIRICKATNYLSEQIPSVEAIFQKMINDTHFLHGYSYSGFNYLLYKYTVELLYDKCPIPDKYICTDNRILYQYPKNYKQLGKRGNIDLVIKLFNCGGLSRMNANYLMRGAAEAGNINILEWANKLYPFSEKTELFPIRDYRIPESVTMCAVKGNNLAVLEWLVENGAKANNNTLCVAAKKGHLDIFKYLVNELKIKTEMCGYYAGLGGHIDIIKIIRSHDRDSLYQVCDGAARNGHLDILKYGYENGQWLEDYFCCEHIHVFEWLIDNNHIKSDVSIPMRIAWTGNLECLQYIYSKGFPVLNGRVFDKAIDGRNIEMLKWLYEMGCPIAENATSTAMDYPSAEAKIGGDLAILKLLLDWGCKMPNKIKCVDPARHGNLELLKYLHEKGGILNKNVINAAVKHGHLEVVIWCREQGCLWDTSTCAAAVEYGHIYMLKWLRGIDRNTCGFKSNETETCPWDSDVCRYAIQYSHTNVLKFAIENGCECNKHVYLFAMKNANNEIKNIIRNYYYGLG